MRMVMMRVVMMWVVGDAGGDDAGGMMRVVVMRAVMMRLVVVQARSRRDSGEIKARFRRDPGGEGEPSRCRLRPEELLELSALQLLAGD